MAERTAASGPYWPILAIGSLVGLVVNVVLAHAFVASTTRESWAATAPRSLGLALALTVISTLLALVGTVWFRREPTAHAVPLILLAALGPAVGWTLIGLAVGGWLLPVYALYGLASGAGFSLAFGVGLRIRRRRTPR